MRLFIKLIIAAALIMPFAHADGATVLNGAGATFPYPVYSAWAYNYNKVTGVQLNYQSIGSGGGIRQVTDRTIDFGASDAPLSPQQLRKDRLLQFPAVIGGVVPVVNIAGIRASQLKLDSEAVCKIYLGEIKNWNDPKIKSLNPGLNLPNHEITVVHRSDGSGTTAIFTNYLSGACPAWKKKVGAGTSVNWPVGIGGKGNEGVANYTRRAADSIGYVEFAYAVQNKLAISWLRVSRVSRTQRPRPDSIPKRISTCGSSTPPASMRGPSPERPSSSWPKKRPTRTRKSLLSTTGPSITATARQRD
jgi:phosphate transport system substrate-binding protein